MISGKAVHSEHAEDDAAANHQQETARTHRHSAATSLSHGPTISTDSKWSAQSMIFNPVRGRVRLGYTPVRYS